MNVEDLHDVESYAACLQAGSSDEENGGLDEVGDARRINTIGHSPTHTSLATQDITT